MIRRVFLREGRRWVAYAITPIVVSPMLAGCGFGGGDAGSVFDVKPGQCFASPTEVKAEVSSIDEVSCDKPHGKEAYARAVYTPAPGPDGKPLKDFPGNDALAAFAQGACAQRFTDYVGVSYLDSSLFFTYLAPSARSWQDDDRTVICFVTSAGRPLTASVKGSKK